MFNINININILVIIHPTPDAGNVKCGMPHIHKLGTGDGDDASAKCARGTWHLHPAGEVRGASVLYLHPAPAPVPCACFMRRAYCASFVVAKIMSLHV
jgi:hypothetical protein